MGRCDVQAAIACCSSCELDATPGSCTSMPENVGSGKLEGPWARMHWAQRNHPCCSADVSCVPVELHGDGKPLHACSAPWKDVEFGSIPVVRYP